MSNHFNTKNHSSKYTVATETTCQQTSFANGSPPQPFSVCPIEVYGPVTPLASEGCGSANRNGRGRKLWANLARRTLLGLQEGGALSASFQLPLPSWDSAAQGQAAGEFTSAGMGGSKSLRRSRSAKQSAVAAGFDALMSGPLLLGSELNVTPQLVHSAGAQVWQAQLQGQPVVAREVEGSCPLAHLLMQAPCGPDTSPQVCEAAALREVTRHPNMLHLLGLAAPRLALDPLPGVRDRLSAARSWGGEQQQQQSEGGACEGSAGADQGSWTGSGPAPTSCLLVMEHCPQTLYDLICDAAAEVALTAEKGGSPPTSSSGSSLSWLRLTHLAWDIARALAHLHSRGLVHGALGSEAVAVRADGSAAVAGFDVMREACAGEVAGLQALLAANEPLDTATVAGRVGGQADDVFAFGSLMYEMATWKQRRHHWPTQEGLVVLEKRDVPLWDCLEPQGFQELRMLMAECWHPDPRARPSFSLLACRLKRIHYLARLHDVSRQVLEKMRRDKALRAGSGTRELARRDGGSCRMTLDMRADSERSSCLSEMMMTRPQRLDSSLSSMDSRMSCGDRVAVRSEKAKLASEWAELESEKAQLKSEKADIRSEKMELRNERSEIKSERAKLTCQRADLESERLELRSERARISEQRAEVERLRVEVEKEAAALRLERLLLERTRVDLQCEREEVERQREEVSQLMSGMEAEAERIKTSQGELTQARTDLELEKERLEVERRELEADRGRMRSERSEIETCKAALESERAQVESEKAVVEGERVRVEAVHAELVKERQEAVAQDKKRFRTLAVELLLALLGFLACHLLDWFKTSATPGAPPHSSRWLDWAVEVFVEYGAVQVYKAVVMPLMVALLLSRGKARASTSTAHNLLGRDQTAQPRRGLGTA